MLGSLLIMERDEIAEIQPTMSMQELADLSGLSVKALYAKVASGELATIVEYVDPKTHKLRQVARTKYTQRNNEPIRILVSVGTSFAQKYKDESRQTARRLGKDKRPPRLTDEQIEEILAAADKVKAADPDGLVVRKKVLGEWKQNDRRNPDAEGKIRWVLDKNLKEYPPPHINRILNRRKSSEEE
jgi:hypothetical protein